jgi:anti-anti-sigma factor
MRLEKTIEDAFTVVKLLEEKLDSRISPALKNEFVTLNTLGARYIILNMEQVRLADSSGLSAILTGKRLCESAGGALLLSGLSAKLKELITISRLDEVLNILPTEEEAREAVYMMEIENSILAQTGNTFEEEGVSEE